MRTYLSLFLILFTPFFAYAANIDGPWEGAVQTGENTIGFSADYKVAGEKLTGSVTINFRGNQIEREIENGVVNGDAFEYGFSVQGRSITHKAKVKNDSEIEITTNRGAVFMVKRVGSKISGNWKGQGNSSYGTVDISPMYEVSGDKIMGKITLSIQGTQIEGEIRNGTVSGDTFKYSYSLRGNEISHEGTLVNDNEIVINSSSGTKFTLARVE